MIIINNNYYSHIWFDRIILNKVAVLAPLLRDLEDNHGLMVVLGWVSHHPLRQIKGFNSGQVRSLNYGLGGRREGGPATFPLICPTIWRVREVLR